MYSRVPLTVPTTNGNTRGRKLTSPKIKKLKRGVSTQ